MTPHANDSYHGNTSDDVGHGGQDPTEPVVQHSLAGIFGSGSDSDSKRAPVASLRATQGAVTRATPTPTREESDDEFENPDAATTSSRIVPVLEDDDVNVLGPQEKLDDYGSDRDTPDDLQDEVGVQENIQENILEVQSPEDEDDEDLITEGFLEVIGGSVRMADGSLNKNALRVMRWEVPTSEFKTDEPEYPGLVHTRGRLTDATRRAATTPLSLTFLFFPLVF